MLKFGRNKLVSLFFLVLITFDTMSQKTDNFINTWEDAAINEAVRKGIPASITMAQAILESGWGESGLSLQANNFFGIKADSSWKGPVYNGATHEVYSGNTVYKNDDFRKYTSPKESFRDHSYFLIENQRYSPLFSLSPYDYVGWAKGLKSSGYATSPTYDSKLIGVIEDYGLQKLDEKARKRRMLYTIGFIALIGLLVVGGIKIASHIFKT